MYSKELNNKLLNFKQWKADNLNYYNGCERELLQTLQNICKIEITDLCTKTNFCQVYEKEFFAQVYCSGVSDVDYAPFINFAKEFKASNLLKM